ncbi:MAG: Uncharacterized protein LiPW15_669 [Parcubacteria group bacterium LiPW_15]|nr:MAG: Uncharacterized protein LiPW15_669 [Parcubacteria group bacterium LiPW_15]
MGPATRKRKEKKKGAVVKKLVLGIVGEKRAGKDTFVRIFARLLKKKGVTVSTHHFSDTIAACLTELGLELSRENMQSFPVLIEAKYGKGVFSRAMARKVKKDAARIVVIQGIRWWTDVAALKALHGTLIYVTADKDVRFRRSVADSEKKDEAGMTRRKFEKQERAKTEIYIPQIAARANFRFENNGAERELTRAIRKFVKERF